MKGHTLRSLVLDAWQRAAKAYRVNPCPETLTAVKVAALEWAALEERRERQRMRNRVWMRKQRAA